VDYPAGTLLAIAAALIGNARRASPHRNWNEPTHLWVGLVGDPSAGKSPGMAPILDIIQKFDRESIEETKRRHTEHKKKCEQAEANLANWKHDHRKSTEGGRPPPDLPDDALKPEFQEAPRIRVSDITPEKLGTILGASPKGVLQVRDELAGWIGGFDRYNGGNGSDRAMWLEAYNGSYHCIDRQKSPAPIIINHFSVGIVGGIQPDRLGLIANGFDDGLASRFIWFWPDPIAEFRIQECLTDDQAATAGLRKLCDLEMAIAEDGSLFPQPVPLSPPAVHCVEEYGGHLRTMKFVGPLAGMIGKGAGTVLRLAITLEYLWWCACPARREPSEVSEAAVVAACASYEDYIIPQGKRVFGEGSIPEPERNAMLLARWLIDNRLTRFNAREASRKILGPVRQSIAMTAACDVLVEAGWIRPLRKSGMGRPRSDFEVNPLVLGEHLE
jgi:hypothetical protein